VQALRRLLQRNREIHRQLPAGRATLPRAGPSGCPTKTLPRKLPLPILQEAIP